MAIYYPGYYDNILTEVTREQQKGQADPSVYSPYGDAARESAEKVANYGDYTSQYTPKVNETLNKVDNYGSYASNYADKINSILDQAQGTYTSDYSEDIDNAVRNLQNWRYDPTQDASYQALAQMYQQNGRQAMQDTLGQISARTGGLASSYAGNAAAGAYENYMNQLASYLPQYEQNAYQRQLSGLSALQNAEDRNYSRWADARNNAYNLANAYSSLDNTDYSRWADERNNLYNLANAYATLDNSDYSRWADDRSNAYNVASMYNTLDQDAYNRWANNMDRYLNLIPVGQSIENHQQEQALNQADLDLARQQLWLLQNGIY